ncbi:cAMP-binding domain of CRP or a regulatory subunit of cAMP-dependent protein kinases [Roseateles sp. YR242]|uniref:Crp/Fnr family transcriptional regulator n=1 Tax=Roseateles sp. YR242 TaxID=1855305 RepID=UPI0008C7442D|nr:Crp/Fnr family transcriptional regulator [Roseateles sp. YR242]SEK22794.1 cAMP-binding domain of CRP or a regulatory subunit of cAMP-dependent protein kinases [Roseateles sp. YR242]
MPNPSTWRSGQRPAEDDRAAAALTPRGSVDDWVHAPVDLLALPQAMCGGTVLLQQGAVPTHVWFLHRGALKASNYADSGRERIKEFYFPGEFCVMYLAWLTGQASRYQVEVVEDATVTSIPIDRWDAPELAELRGRLLREQLTFKERKEEMLLLHSPEQRYLYVQLHFPTWTARLSQRQLAAYIGITEVSLSRIRGRLKGSLPRATSPRGSYAEVPFNKG